MSFSLGMLPKNQLQKNQLQMQQQRVAMVRATVRCVLGAAAVVLVFAGVWASSAVAKNHAQKPATKAAVPASEQNKAASKEQDAKESAHTHHGATKAETSSVSNTSQASEKEHSEHAKHAEHAKSGAKKEAGHAHKDTHEHAHELHPAHVHGIAEMKLAYTETKAVLEAHVPLHSLLGFEHAPKTEAQKKKVAMAQKKFLAAQLFAWEPSAGCKEASSGVDFHYGEEHGEAELKVSYECQKISQTFTVKFKELFPSIEKVNVEVSPPGKKKAYKKSFTTPAFSLSL